MDKNYENLMKELKEKNVLNEEIWKRAGKIVSDIEECRKVGNKERRKELWMEYYKLMDESVKVGKEAQVIIKEIVLQRKRVKI